MQKCGIFSVRTSKARMRKSCEKTILVRKSRMFGGCKADATCAEKRDFFSEMPYFRWFSRCGNAALGQMGKWTTHGQI